MSGGVYAGQCFVLVTQHDKSAAIAPPFSRILGASVLEYVADTDRLGTFSGEIERQGSALEIVRQKCLLALEEANATYALASEGSFGPHPILPLLPASHEILYMIDQIHGFHIHISDTHSETNYRTGEVTSKDALFRFAEDIGFPEHGVILRPFGLDKGRPVLKDMMTFDDLEDAYNEACKINTEGKVRIETDMRAHKNPTRMATIGRLAEKLALRLNCLCPYCQTPGWGKVDIEIGLPCARCGGTTQEISHQILGCAKCDYREKRPFKALQDKGNPKFCLICNP